MPAHLAHNFAALNRNTWAGAGHHNGIMRLGRGCQAGVPLADIAFLLEISVTTKAIRADLRDEGLTTE